MELDYDAQEARITAACRQVGLGGGETEMLLLLLVDQETPRRIRRLVKAKRLSDVQATLQKSLAKLKALSGFWDAAYEFIDDLLFCAADRRTYDERPRGVHGVAPYWEPERVPAVTLLTAHHPALRQDVVAAARLWADRQREAECVPV